MIEKYRQFLLRYGAKFGKAAWIFYALVFLLLMSTLLGLVYVLLGGLMYFSPDAVLVLTALLVLLIFYRQIKKSR